MTDSEKIKKNSEFVSKIEETLVEQGWKSVVSDDNRFSQFKFKIGDVSVDVSLMKESFTFYCLVTSRVYNVYDQDQCSEGLVGAYINCHGEKELITTVDRAIEKIEELALWSLETIISGYDIRIEIAKQMRDEGVPKVEELMRNLRGQ